MTSDLQTHFPFLRGSIGVLVVDPCPQEMDMLTSMLCNCFLYRIRFARSSQQADSLLARGIDCDVCISEVCTEGPQGEQFRIQRNHGRRIPIVYVSKLRCLETGFRLNEMGARAVFGKPLTHRKCAEIVATINRCFLDGMVRPPDAYTDDHAVTTICDTLRRKTPESMEDWAHKAGYDVSYLRKRWKGLFGTTPKYHLHVYRLFSHVLTYVPGSAEEPAEHTACGNSDIAKSRDYISRHADVLRCVVPTMKRARTFAPQI